MRKVLVLLLVPLALAGCKVHKPPKVVPPQPGYGQQQG